MKNCPLLGVTIGLAKELRKREEEINKYSKNRIQIVADGGVKMKNILTQKDPFLNLKCEKRKCAICDFEVGNIPSCDPLYSLFCIVYGNG